MKIEFEIGTLVKIYVKPYYVDRVCGTIVNRTHLRRTNRDEAHYYIVETVHGQKVSCFTKDIQVDWEHDEERRVENKSW